MIMDSPSQVSCWNDKIQNAVFQKHSDNVALGKLCKFKLYVRLKMIFFHSEKR